MIEAEVDLAAAENTLTQAREALADTAVIAPFDGRLEELPIEVGEFISAGEPAARVVDISPPLTVTIQVPQQLRNRLVLGGAEAQVAFLTGEVATGTIQFIAAAADPTTRTFLTEIEIANDTDAFRLVSAPRSPSPRARSPRISSRPQSCHWTVRGGGLA